MSQYNPNIKRAVAVKYDDDKNPAPIIVASGLGRMAEKIVETAVENNVPVFEDSSLSTVLSQLELGAEIPEELYQAVVDIYVYFLRYAPNQIMDEAKAREQVKVEIKPQASMTPPETRTLSSHSTMDEEDWRPFEFPEDGEK